MGRKYASIFVRADAMNGEALRSVWESANPMKPLAMPDPVSIMEKLGLGSDVDEKQAGVLRAIVSKFKRSRRVARASLNAARRLSSMIRASVLRPWRMRRWL